MDFRGARLSAFLIAGALALSACQSGGNASEANGAANQNVVSDAASEYDVVRAMLELANVGAADLVVDLGSGDGRIPIMAAREKGARGLGVDNDPDMIRQANRNAAEAGVTDRVRFRQEDLFATPLNDVTVLTLYLVTEVNIQLRPKILSQMRPGTRVVSNTFDMGDWRPDQRRAIGGTTIFLWVVPAQVAGRWRLTRGTAAADMALTQHYQDVSGSAGGAPLQDAQLRGDRIAFTADLGKGAQRFEGRIEGNRIAGDGWEAVRTGG